MKLDEFEILQHLTNPASLLSYDQLTSYTLLMQTGHENEVKKLLTDIQIEYYRAVRPSSKEKKDTDASILEYGINSYVTSIITEKAFEFYLLDHDKKYQSTGGAYSTYEEQKQTLGKVDYIVEGKAIEIKSTTKPSFDKWYHNLKETHNLWKLHNADKVILFTDCRYDWTTNTFTFKGDVYMGELYDFDAKYYFSFPWVSAYNDFKNILSEICATAGINYIFK